MRTPSAFLSGRLTLLFAAGVLVTVGSAARADSIKWYTGGAGYVGPAFTNAAGTVYQATQGLATNCPTPASGCSGADVIANGQIYNPSGSHTVQVTASATVGGNAWADLQPAFGGMGVGLAGGNDHIDGTDILQLVFATPITLTGVGTLFEQSLHGPFGVVPLATDTFALSVDGGAFVNVQFGTANNSDGGAFNLSFTGTDFRFMQNSGEPEFYVSALTYAAVPGPIVGAGLPGLVLATGGFIAWRRTKRKKAAVAA
jgi:hypothetical protein